MAMQMMSMSESQIDNTSFESELERGVRMIQHAFAERNDTLTKEMKSLERAIGDSKATLADWQKKKERLENELTESQNRTKKLSSENQELMKTEQHLSQQVMRLEKLKQVVLSSVQDDKTMELKQNEQMGALPFGMDEQYLHSSALGQQQIASPGPAAYAAPAPPAYMSTASMGGMGGFASAPADMPAAPPVSAAPMPAPAPAAPAAGGAVDGKQFFRGARSRLSYEAFNLFLASIKRLNNQQQTREETLAEAMRIFGPDNQDLYKDFEALLNRQGV